MSGLRELERDIRECSKEYIKTKTITNKQPNNNEDTSINLNVFSKNEDRKNKG